MAKHQAPDRHPVRDRTAVRTMALAMIGLAIFVLAMIASYSGAFAKPTLHHMTVAVAGPQQLVDGIRGQESLAVTQVGDGAAARQQVYERKSDAAFVASPTGQLQIYVAGGGGKSVASAAETIGRAVAAKANLAPTVEDVAPPSAGDPSGTVEFYAIIFISIGASVGATVLGRLMGTVRRPLTLALRTATLAGYSALLAGVVTIYVDVILGALTGHTWQVFGALWLYSMAVGGAITGVAAAFGSVASMAADRVPRGDRKRCGRRPGGPTPALGLLLDVHRHRAAGVGRLAAAECLLLRRQRCADAAGHAGDLGCGGVLARNRSHGVPGELSCRL